MKSMTALIIMDGFGYSPKREYNAIALQGTPHIMDLLYRYPHTNIRASGEDVGLPDGQMGNSEVGHLNIGAGRIVYQELTRITKAIREGDFFRNPALAGVMDSVIASGGTLHLMGLLSDGGVHSHITHLFALLDMAKARGVARTVVHCFMDGRDVPPKSGADYIAQLLKYMEKIGYGSIATVSGRYYAMDRDKRWDRVQRAYEAVACGKGVHACCGRKAMAQSYSKDVTDEFVEPTVVGDYQGVRDGDGIIFFNFRPDRARELTRAFKQPDFDGFERQGGMKRVAYATMTQYDETFQDWLDVAFRPQTLVNTLGSYLADQGLTQLRIAETEKYAHVTFFFNGGVEEPNANEDRILIPSPKEVATYDQKPQMSAYEVADKAVECIESGKYDVMILNFANCDMVGHTGVLEATVKAVEAVDNCVDKVVKAVLATGGRAIITADHGNAEKMWDEETNAPHTAHTTNPVVCILADETRRGKVLRMDGRLADIAPTMLELLGLPKPAEMEGKSLILS
ncbi:MAG: 2,3-bisphosphoglycerate-independent phosphoglycerate mutase [Eubacteriales bacterium]|nr:2,3-bisphosphoglycerate-independent phosphoglycerate mutase [Eubacteriales bacterium]